MTDIATGEMIIEPDDRVYGIDQSTETPGVELGPDGYPLVPGNVQTPPPVAVDNGPVLDDAWLERTLNDGQRKPPG